MANKLKPCPDFIAGYCCALSALARTHGQPGMALDIFRGGGFTLKDLSGVDEYDASPIKKEWRRAKWK